MIGRKETIKANKMSREDEVQLGPLQNYVLVGLLTPDLTLLQQ